MPRARVHLAEPPLDLCLDARDGPSYSKRGRTEVQLAEKTPKGTGREFRSINSYGVDADLMPC